jgi:hypothetical protein
LYIDQLLAYGDARRLQHHIARQEQQNQVEALRQALLEHTRARFGQPLANMGSHMVTTNPKYVPNLVDALPHTAWFFKGAKKAQKHYHLVKYMWAEVGYQPLFQNLLTMIKSFAPQPYAHLTIESVCLAFALQDNELGFIYLNPHTPRMEGAAGWPCVNNNNLPHHGEKIYFELNITGRVLHALCGCKCADKCGNVITAQRLTDAMLTARKRSCACRELSEVVQKQLDHLAAALRNVVNAIVLAQAPPSTTLVPALLNQSQQLLNTPHSPRRRRLPSPPPPRPSLSPPLSEGSRLPLRRPSRSPPLSEGGRRSVTPPLFDHGDERRSRSPPRQRRHGVSPPRTPSPPTQRRRRRSTSPPQQRAPKRQWSVPSQSFLAPASYGRERDPTKSVTEIMLANSEGAWTHDLGRLLSITRAEKPKQAPTTP